MKLLGITDSLSISVKQLAVLCAMKLQLRRGSETKGFAGSVGDMCVLLNAFETTLSPAAWAEVEETILSGIYSLPTQHVTTLRDHNETSA